MKIIVLVVMPAVLITFSGCANLESKAVAMKSDRSHVVL